MNEIRLLSLDELKEIYDTYMRKDFPLMEMRPFRALRRMWNQGRYAAYGRYEGTDLEAYACFYSCRDQRCALMDYLAVVPDRRDCGIGSAFLRGLVPTLTQWDGILVEAESAASAADETDREERKKRLRFYQRNGAVPTGMNCRLFGVDYSLLYIPVSKEKEERDLKGLVNGLYREMYGRACGSVCRPYESPDPCFV